jgi:hypothetical protein
VSTRYRWLSKNEIGKVLLTTILPFLADSQSYVSVNEVVKLHKGDQKIQGKKRRKKEEEKTRVT